MPPATARYPRRAVTWVVRTAAFVLFVSGLALAGCREERPTGTGDPPPKDPGVEQPDKPDAPDPPVDPDDKPIPDEPLPDVRAKLQAEGTLVVTVHSRGITWIDGELALGPALLQRLSLEAEKTDMQPAVVIFYPQADKTSLGQFQSFERMMRRFEFREVRHVWGGPGWEGLGPPADTAEGPVRPPDDHGPIIPIPPGGGG